MHSLASNTNIKSCIEVPVNWLAINSCFRKSRTASVNASLHIIQNTEVSTVSFFKRLSESPVFNNVSLLAILITAVAVGLETSPALSTQYKPVLRALEIGLLCFFIGEALVRFLGTWPRAGDYFKDGWNVFDLAVIVVCLLPIDGHFAAVIRLARILRILRVVRMFPRLRVIVSALMKGVSSMGYIALLLSVLFYIFAVLGVFLFGPKDAEHFGSIPTAFLTLFQIVTLEGWVDIMDAQISAGGSPIGTPIYFISFIVLGTMIVLNLFIGAIVGSMSEAQEEHDSENAQEKKAMPPVPGNRESILNEIALLEKQADEMKQRFAALKSALKS